MKKVPFKIENLSFKWHFLCFQIKITQENSEYFFEES